MGFEKYLEQHVANIDPYAVDEALVYLGAFKRTGRVVYVAGNGGSAFTSNHFVQDLNKACSMNATSLSESVGMVTAIGNDIGFEDIFEFQLRNKASGLLVLISFSGTSPNIIEAAKYWRNKGNTVISLTGRDGGELKNYSDIHVNVSTDNIFVAESLHSYILHYFVDMLKDAKNELDVS